MARRRLWCKIDTQSGEVRVYLVTSPVDEEGNGVSGLYDPDKAEILIDSSLSEQAKKSTLLHEILHVLWSHVGGDLRAALLGDEELIVSFLEPALYDLLTRNGWLKFPKPVK